MGGSYFMTSNTEPEADTNRAEQHDFVLPADGAKRSSASPYKTYLKVRKTGAAYTQL